MLGETLKSFIKGHITIRDRDTGEVIVDKDNAIHFGNISTEIAQALTGRNDSFIRYMAFGNGGVIVDNAGNIIYRDTNTSVNKNPNDQLYNTVLIYELDNNDNPLGDVDVDVPGGNTSNFEDIVTTVVLEPGTPSTQQNIDNAGNVNDQANSDTQSNFVFNEIALYTGEIGTGGGSVLEDQSSINNFLAEADKILITHVIFHPVQKSLNRTLEVTYTLRIQMGD
jgi:hypothetical protein